MRVNRVEVCLFLGAYRVCTAFFVYDLLIHTLGAIGTTEGKAE